MPAIVPVSFEDLTTPQSVADIKATLLAQLADLGFPALSWETGSVPSGLVEIQANSVADLQADVATIALSGLNSTATGEGLTIHAFEVYDNTRDPGLSAIGYVTLTDSGNAGPFTFDATGTTYSKGSGGLSYNGLYDADTLSTTVTIPQGGSRNVLVKAASVGSAYNAATGAINFFARGVLPGVTVTNPSNWLSRYAGSTPGTDPETDDQLRVRDSTKWGTLGTGSPASAYMNWALDADEAVKKVAVFSNLNMFDPGRVDVYIAGLSTAVSPTVVQTVQNYIAPNQTGGSKIPETAKCVVTSATQHNVTVNATIYVQAAYNNAAFLAQIDAALQTYIEGLDIGAFISTDRILQVMLSPAGLNAGIITDANMTSPLVDIQLAFNEVAALAGTRVLVSAS